MEGGGLLSGEGEFERSVFPKTGTRGYRMTSNCYNYNYLKFHIFLLFIGSGMVSLLGQVRSGEPEFNSQ